MNNHQKLFDCIYNSELAMIKLVQSLSLSQAPILEIKAMFRKICSEMSEYIVKEKKENLKNEIQNNR